MKYFIILSLMSFAALGQNINNVNQGQTIEANKMNELFTCIHKTAKEKHGFLVFS